MVSSTLTFKHSEEESRNILVYVEVLYFGLRCVGLVSRRLISKYSEEGISEESRRMLVYVGVF
jgi:hypothetical protein